MGLSLSYLSRIRGPAHYVRISDPDLIPPGRYPALDALSGRCEARPAFKATYPAEYAVPRND
jgi:glutathione S-transferase